MEAVVQGGLDVPEALGFDIHGTLVDPLDMNEYPKGLIGEQADAVFDARDIEPAPVFENLEQLAGKL